MPIAALLIFVTVFTTRSVHLLLIEDVRGAHPVLVAKVKPGDRLAMGFLHSVEHCRVWDHLQIDKQYGLEVVATEFAESRTGLPYAAFEGEVFERRNDGFVISNMHRSIPEMYQWVDTTYENTLKINDKRVIALASLAGNTLLHIRIVKRTVLEWLVTEAGIFWSHKRF
jgi:hypothetical protein